MIYVMPAHLSMNRPRRGDGRHTLEVDAGAQEAAAPLTGEGSGHAVAGAALFHARAKRGRPLIRMAPRASGDSCTG